MQQQYVTCVFGLSLRWVFWSGYEHWDWDPGVALFHCIAAGILLHPKLGLHIEHFTESWMPHAL